MRILEVDTVYTGERLKVPMRIDVDSATWLNNRQKPTKGTMYECGYYYWLVTLENGKKKHLRVHRQVWYAVNGKIPEDKQIDHIDSDKSHNYISNLQLLTPKENCNKADKLEKQSLVLRGKGGLLTKEQAQDIFVLAKKEILSQRKIGELFGVKQETVYNIKAQNSWKWATEGIGIEHYKYNVIDIEKIKG